MPPKLALFGSFIFIIVLFIRDARERPAGSSGLWVPGLLLLILSTRPVVYWFSIYSGSMAGLGHDNDVEGDMTDLLLLGTLIVSACIILRRRQLNWAQFTAGNLSILVIYMYFLSSVLWADYPIAVCKRVVKDASLMLFALVILTERDPSYAIRKLFVRCSYIVFTLSVVTIKYFPGVGTRFTRSGDNQFIGLTTQKNMLGEVTFVYLLVLIWDVVLLRKDERVSWYDPRILARASMILMGIWLVNVSESKTSLLCFAMGVAIYWGTGLVLKLRAPKFAIVTVFVVAATLYGLNSVFHFEEMVVRSVGKNMTFTGRTLIWDIVLAQPVNPVVGTGFMMFWDTSLGNNALMNLQTRISTAHNGYIEVYLDGGIIGVTLLGIMLLARGNYIINRMIAREFWGRLAFAFWLLALFQDLSESSFFRFSILWFMLIFSMVKVPQFVALPEKDPEPFRPQTTW